MPRRSYDQYCAIARALDAVGDRWALLVVRELLAGPRRYTELHADLPGVSTDVLAARLKDLEREGVATRRRLPPPGAATVYELTPRGRGLLPVLAALAAWGADGLAERSPTDAVRAHWFAVPLLHRLERVAGGRAGVVEVALEEGTFHLRLGGQDPPSYGDGPAEAADVRLATDADTCVALARDVRTVADAVAAGRITVTGRGPLADALRSA
ncbi:winged helix-turn-helix transcriptional regulator [Planomonospora parontospora]|uniref:winged helix-turn-helix transcriptional regulator n=1 Tax=Planomonospora parontospora TaxID=58119 RepID=UPI0016706148|nr:helix-turn-helix domain-containing protein [Planomonospora parontospora]GGL51373.1 transcriptional regulator [Planomonospora parontospora subsp. antibiotica]GII19098.1 transcriptional regulator [Planomonospora parontospora subsp. antibiotica]